MSALLQRNIIAIAAISALIACSILFIGGSAHALSTQQYTTTASQGWNGHAGNNANGTGNHNNGNTNHDVNNNWSGNSNGNNGGGNNWNHNNSGSNSGYHHHHHNQQNNGSNNCYQWYWNGYSWVSYYACGYGYGGIY